MKKRFRAQETKLKKTLINKTHKAHNKEWVKPYVLKNLTLFKRKPVMNAITDDLWHKN